VTTITGGAVAAPRNLDVRLGTRIADLIAACGGYSRPVARLIKGGSMMGVALESDEVPVGRSTNCIIAATEAEVRQDFDALPCIRCGNCADACPAYLQPQEIFLAGQHGELGALENLGLFDCIECGCCDVVCPSQIRLTDSFRVSKRRLVQAMAPDARVRWLDAREQLRRQRVESFEREHEHGSSDERPPPQARLEAVAELVARVSGKAEAANTSRGKEQANA
jgi:electron transport complex protein RnfC